MQSLINKIRGKVLAENGHDSGADSYFLRVSETMGAKLFVTKLMRDRNHDRFLAYAPVAPKVGACFETEYLGKKMYGFFVEIVQVYDANFNGFVLEDVRKQLYAAINNYGYNSCVMYDMHLYNIGRTMDGRPVVIDFSRFVDEDGFSHTDLRGRSYMYDENDDVYEIEVDDETGTWAII